jgi:hypothetical protein
MTIENLAHNVLALREKSQELLHSDDIEAWLDHIPKEFRAAEELHDYLLSNPVVVTDDPKVRKLLVGTDLGELKDPDKTGSELLFSWISPAEYASALAQVRILVTPFRIPLNLQSFIDEARQCYALEQYAAVQSLSRTVLEAAVNDIAVRIGKIPKKAIEDDMFQEYPPKKRIRMVAGSEFDTIYNHYRDLCTVIHGVSTSASTGPLESLTKTLGLVDYLYQSHKETMRTKEVE